MGNPTELPKAPLDKVDYYVNFDMIGSYESYGNQVDACGTMTKTPALPLLQSLLSSRPGLKVNLEIPGFAASDSDYDSDYYTFDRVDDPHMSEIARARDGAGAAVGR